MWFHLIYLRACKFCTDTGWLPKHRSEKRGRVVRWHVRLVKNKGSQLKVVKLSCANSATEALIRAVAYSTRGHGLNSRSCQNLLSSCVEKK